MDRIPVTKTPKVYVGGAFIRSESARVLPVYSKEGALLGNVPDCTRKDVRNAVEAASGAAPGWAKRTAYNRAQILYRLGEMLESRSAEVAECLCEARGLEAAAAKGEVTCSVDRVIYYAGWADKFGQVLGNTNAVAGPYFNFTLPEALGVVGVLMDESAPALLGIISQIAPILAGGNVVVALASEPASLLATLLGEVIAVCDIPAGVVNILTGRRSELLSVFATHQGIRAVDAAGISQDERLILATGAAESVKRLKVRMAGATQWHLPEAQGLEEIADFVEFKTIWHPVGA